MNAVQSPHMTTQETNAPPPAVSGEIPPGAVVELSPGVFAISLRAGKSFRVWWVLRVTGFVVLVVSGAGVVAGLAGGLTSSAPIALLSAIAVVILAGSPLVRRYLGGRRALFAEFADAAGRARGEADRAAVASGFFRSYADQKRALLLHFGITGWDRGLIRDLAALFPVGSVVLIPWNDANAAFAPLGATFEPVPLTHVFTLGDPESPAFDPTDPLGADRFSWESARSAKIRRRRIVMWIARIALAIFVVTIVGPMLIDLLVTGRMPPSMSSGLASGSVIMLILGVAVALQRRWHILPGGVAVQPSILSSLWRSSDAARFSRDDSTLIVWGRAPIVCRTDGRVELSGQPLPARYLEPLIRAWRCTAPTPPPEFLRSWFGEEQAP